MQREQRFSQSAPMLLAGLVISAAVALWLAIVLFGAVVLASPQGNRSMAVVVFE
jgi:hypothetical protein